jgi:nicotinamide riboside kinase
LAKKLSSHYNSKWVPEYAVEYLQKKGEKYDTEDILMIAKGQLFAEDLLAKESKTLLFCDTDLLVNKIWSSIVFNKVPEWIDEMVAKHRYDMYLLCFPDIDWQPGPFRENPYDREPLFSLYEKEIIKLGVNYRIVTGDGEQRLENAINFVDELM